MCLNWRVNKAGLSNQITQHTAYTFIAIKWKCVYIVLYKHTKWKDSIERQQQQQQHGSKIKITVNIYGKSLLERCNSFIFIPFILISALNRDAERLLQQKFFSLSAKFTWFLDLFPRVLCLQVPKSSKELKFHWFKDSER